MSVHKSLVAVYFSDPAPMGNPFNLFNGTYLRGYLELGRHIERLGGRYCFVRGRETFLGKGGFSRCFWPGPDGSVCEEASPIVADVVLNKDEDIPFDDGTSVVNEPAFHTFCNDKPATYARFSNVSPKTFTARSPSELKLLVAELPGDRIVAKPAWGYGSIGVVVGSRAEILSTQHDYFPLVVQQWIDTSDGVPGVCASRHELRLVFVGSDIALALIKVPEAGKLVYAFSRGGSVRILDDELVPREPLLIARTIDASFADVASRYYSIDLARNIDGKWYIIELNSPPGINEEAEHANVVREHRLTAEMLLREARRTRS